MFILKFCFAATLEMMSVAPGEIVLRGEVSNRYIGMDSHGNLLTYVSINDVTDSVVLTRILSVSHTRT